MWIQSLIKSSFLKDASSIDIKKRKEKGFSFGDAVW
jgi:hypothetical protein